MRHLSVVFGLGLLLWLAYRGWSVLLVGPAAAVVAAFSGEPSRRSPIGRGRSWVPQGGS
jgi:hypothetical protein